MKDLQEARKYLVMAGMDDQEGLFVIPFRSFQLKVIASHGLGWDHVSVSLPNRCPNWEEMCFIKSLFFDEEECVMQLHPPKSKWISNHPHCLHMWRPQETEIPLPLDVMVGVKEWGELDTDEKREAAAKHFQEVNRIPSAA